MRARILTVVVLGWSNAALAQWNPQMTADLGRGMGQIALSQSVLSGTRRIGSDDNSPRPATLTYVPDPHVSERTRQSVADSLSHDNPALRQQMDTALKNGKVLMIFDRFMSTHGLSSHNVADSMAMQLVVSWEIATGKMATPAQIHGTDAQVRNLFLNTPKLRDMTNNERQAMAESIAYQVVIGSAASRQAQRAGDQAQLTQLRQTATTILRDRGVDLSRQQLTDHGFVKAS